MERESGTEPVVPTYPEPETPAQLEPEPEDARGSDETEPGRKRAR